MCNIHRRELGLTGNPRWTAVMNRETILRRQIVIAVSTFLLCHQYNFNHHMNVLWRARIKSDTKHVTCQSHYTITLAWDVNFSGLTLSLGLAFWKWDNICIEAQSTACQQHLKTSVIQSVDSSKDWQEMWIAICVYFNEFRLLCLWVLLLRTLKPFYIQRVGDDTSDGLLCSHYFPFYSKQKVFYNWRS